MNSLILIFLIWFPISIILNEVVGSSSFIEKKYKKIIFYAITFPVLWVKILEKTTDKYWKTGWLKKISEWFKN